MDRGCCFSCDLIPEADTAYSEFILFYVPHLDDCRRSLMPSINDESIGLLCIHIVNPSLKYARYENLGYDYHKRKLIQPKMYCTCIWFMTAWIFGYGAVQSKVWYNSIDRGTS